MGIPAFITFHFPTSLWFPEIAVFIISWSFFNRVLSRSIGTIFPAAFAHLVSLQYVLVILGILHTFALLLCSLHWSVSRDLWSYYCGCGRPPGIGHIWNSDPSQWIRRLCVLTVLLTGPSSSRLTLLGPPYFLRHHSTEIRPINNATVASWCSSERQGHPSLTLKQQLEMIKLSKEGRWKAVKGRKPAFLHLCGASCKCECEVLEGNYTCCASEHINNKKMKQPHCWYGESFSGLCRRSHQPQYFLKTMPHPEQGPNSSVL